MLALLLAAQRPEPILESISRPDLAAVLVFQAKDDQGKGLDCLKVEQAARDRYLGVHHRKRDDGFELCLVESSDLKTWKHKRVVSVNAHQGTIARTGARWLLAWEQTGKDGNHLRLEGYASLQNLEKGIVEKSIDVTRTLSTGTEGTPSIDSIAYNRGWDRSVIKLGFHYYRDLDVDRQASGTLTGFSEWTAAPLAGINKPLEPVYKGNVGDRDTANFGAYAISLMEAQLAKNDWASWRILARVGQGQFKPIDIKTPGNSTSFANPSITALTLPDGRPGAFVSLFLPSQGNHEKESGQLIYAFPVEKRQ